jgi:hypothetical protein
MTKTTAPTQLSEWGNRGNEAGMTKTTAPTQLREWGNRGNNSEGGDAVREDVRTGTSGGGRESSSVK